MTAHSYEIAPRPAELGGGYRLSLIEDGLVVGGSVFPLESGPANSDKDAYANAIAEGESWLLDYREPPADKAVGIAWWNALSELERSQWLAIAGSAVAADAWAAFKSQTRL